MKKSTNIKTSPSTVQKMTKPMMSWMEKKLLTSVVKVRLQPAKSTMEKKAGNEKVTTQRRAKQLQGWRAKIGLIKWMKLMTKKRELTKRCKN